MTQRITLTVTADYPDDMPAEDVEGIREDVEDVCRGFGGAGVIIGTLEERV